MSANALFDLPAGIASDPAKLQALIAAPEDKIQGMVDEWTGKKKEGEPIPAVASVEKSPPPTAELSPIPPALTVPPPVATADEYKYIVTLPNAVTLRFRDEKELNQHMINQQKVIDKLNGERGQIGTLKNRSEQLEGQVKTLQDQLQRLSAVAQPLPSMTAATAAAPAGTPAPVATGVQPSPQQDFSLLIKQAVDEAVMPLKEKLSHYEQMTTEEKRSAIFNAQFQSVANEVNSFIKAEMPTLTTSMPFEKINEIVTDPDRKDQIEAHVTPSDLAKFNQIMEILDIYYDHDADGNVDIGKKRLYDISEASTIWRKRSGMDALTSATAQNNSAQAVLAAVDRAANRSPSLPPTAPAQPTGEAGITLDEAKRHIDAANKDPVAYNNDPLLKQKLSQSIRFVNTLT
jgi:chaperonin cofactor prefoldin